ncbi:hypothetical protein NDU88_008201 [Pleurodeles waltl]|uniref:Integrase p58-like C-terminal domain-containing protein n=1 Tax=Pleurodeles waltl TaxID=8319 RepID=A0AAV7P044_PLEWA|nr:hypothetical protein NDU88_008201 [Pleurodeles waltl]
MGGVNGPKKVVVATDLPVECLLGNDLACTEVDLEAHAAMLGIPGHIFALTRAQAKKQRGQGNMDPGIMDQVLPKTSGQKVWVLEPVAPRALQDKWSGPNRIVEKKGKVTYLVDLGSARSPLRVLHVNRLKPYYDRADLTLLMATDEGQEEEIDPLPNLFFNTKADGLVEGVVLADCLTAEQKEDCKNLLDPFSEVFSLTPGTTTWCEHTIDTGDSLPVKSKISRQPDHVRDCIKAEVQKMLDLGAIEPSDSPWACPVVLVPKPDSKEGKREMRFCVDYRGLDTVTKTDAHPIPRADVLIDTLASAKYLSTFDLTAGYWQIKISEDAKAKTAFSTIGGH